MFISLADIAKRAEAGEKADQLGKLSVGHPLIYFFLYNTDEGEVDFTNVNGLLLKLTWGDGLRNIGLADIAFEMPDGVTCAVYTDMEVAAFTTVGMERLFTLIKGDEAERVVSIINGPEPHLKLVK